MVGLTGMSVYIAWMAELKKMFSDQPLASYNLFRSGDIDQAREIVASKFCDHALAPSSINCALDAVHNRLSGNTIALNYLKYGTDIQISPGYLEHFYLVQIPILGFAEITNGRQTLIASNQFASVLNPDLHTRMEWFEGCEKVLLQIDAMTLKHLAESAIGYELNSFPRFDVAIDLSRPEAQNWVRKIAACFHGAETQKLFGNTSNISQPLIEEQIILDLLKLQPGTVHHYFDEVRKDANPKIIRRARNYIHQQIRQPVTCIQVARAAGTSERNLQYLFRQHLGMGPVAYLRQERLKLAHLELQSNDCDRTVADIALETGFTHLGRFSALYRNAFGISPSKTLRENRF